MSKIFICTVLLLFSLTHSRGLANRDSGLSKKNNDSLSVTEADILKNNAVIDSNTKSADTNLKKSAQVKIITEPPKAAVVFDDSVMGLSPVTAEGISLGKHNLVLKKKGYYVRKAQLQIDSSVTLEFVLTRPGSIYFTSKPSGARVYMDEKDAGVTPFFDSVVKPGKYSIRVEASGYNPLEREITVSGGISDTLNFVLKHAGSDVDSIKTVQVDRKKNGKKVKTIIVASAFALFGLVLLFMESFGQK